VRKIEQCARLSLFYVLGSYLGAGLSMSVFSALHGRKLPPACVIPGWLSPLASWFELFIGSGVAAVMNVGGLIVLNVLTVRLALHRRDPIILGAGLGAVTSVLLWGVLYVCELRLGLRFAATTVCGILWAMLCAAAVSFPYLKGRYRRGTPT